jgi:hypothetical protein
MRPTTQSAFALIAATMLALSGCRHCRDCPTDAQVVTATERVSAQKYVKTELYFGLSKPNGAISEAEWQKFLDEQITPVFKDGLTVVDANGQWLGENKMVVKEKSKLLIVLHAPDAETDAKIKTLIARYKEAFQQQSVLRTTTAVDVSFE